MDFLKEYQLIMSAVISWAAAQILKAVISTVMTKKFDPARLLGTGGMPSSHSSTVTALCVTSFFLYGAASFEFAVSFILMTIVQVDSMGVRLETGKQAELLNRIIEINEELKRMAPEKRLKELVGHTPYQVMMGTLLGFAAAVIINFIVRIS